MTQTVLITGAGTGFGKNIAFALAEKGNPVIATVEVMSQVSALEQEARERGVKMQIEKLDVTNPKDREKAWAWYIRSEEHTSEFQSRFDLVCRLLLEKKMLDRQYI